MRVVPALDPFEHGHACFALGLEASAVEQFALERGEEALGHRVVVRIANEVSRDVANSRGLLYRRSTLEAA